MRDGDSIDYMLVSAMTYHLNKFFYCSLICILLYYARYKDYIIICSSALPLSYVIAGNKYMFPKSSNVIVRYRSVSIVVALAQLNVTFV